MLTGGGLPKHEEDRPDTGAFLTFFRRTGTRVSRREALDAEIRLMKTKSALHLPRSRLTLGSRT